MVKTTAIVKVTRQGLRQCEGVRTCDVCGETISKGQKYAFTVIPKEKRYMLASLNEASPEVKPTFTQDAEGKIRLEIGLDCKMNMGTSSEIVN